MAENLKQTPYYLMGGEAVVNQLVETFYSKIDVLVEAQGIRKMHAADLANAKSKLFKFLSGWLGGPNLFVQEFGHPMLRKRHFPFAIGLSERDQWMLCMNQAMAELEVDVTLKESLLDSLNQLATHMINQ
jgi:hemoglobin